MTGKERCEFLRRIRKNMAEMNNLDYEPHECTYEGECFGHCPVCEAETSDLLRQLENKVASGETIITDNESIEALSKMSKDIEDVVNDVFSVEEHAEMGDIINPNEIYGNEMIVTPFDEDSMSFLAGVPAPLDNEKGSEGQVP